MTKPKKLPQYMTIAELLDALGFPAGAVGRESIRQQIYRWCRTKPESRTDRPSSSTRKAKLVEGIHWTTAANGERLFDRSTVDAVKVLRGKRQQIVSTSSTTRLQGRR